MKHIEILIENYIKEKATGKDTLGCLICGSYASGNYNSESDIDILILKKEHPFEMLLESYQGLLFDRLFVDTKLLETILYEESELSNILSLSFGLAQSVYITSTDITNIIKISKENITKRQLTYTKAVNKPKKNIDGIPLYVMKVEEQYHLVKNDQVIV
jgi:hypothetical protein